MNNYNLEEDRRNLKPMIALFKSHQSLSRIIKEDIKKYDFDLNEFAVIEVIYHYNCLRVSEINEKVLVNSSSLTYILDKLVNKGLIQRVKDQDDKRVIIIEITNEGKKLGDEIFPKHYQMLNNIFDVITDDERVILTNLLKKIGLEANSYGGEK